MTDFIDDTLKREQHLLELQIQQARQAPPAPSYTGECLECGEPLPEPRRWCDRKCAAQWEKRR